MSSTAPDTPPPAPPEPNLVHLSVYAHSAFMLREAIAAGCPLDDPDWTGVPPLVQAAERGQCDMVHILLAAGADIEVRDDTGRTPLMRACMAHEEAAALLLLRAGADPMAQDVDGYTPRVYGGVDMGASQDLADAIDDSIWRRQRRACAGAEALAISEAAQRPDSATPARPARPRGL